jgi:hypothetical protein
MIENSGIENFLQAQDSNYKYSIAFAEGLQYVKNTYGTHPQIVDFYEKRNDSGLNIEVGVEAESIKIALDTRDAAIRGDSSKNHLKLSSNATFEQIAFLQGVEAGAELYALNYHPDIAPLVQEMRSKGEFFDAKPLSDFKQQMVAKAIETFNMGIEAEQHEFKPEQAVTTNRWTDIIAQIDTKHSSIQEPYRPIFTR